MGRSLRRLKRSRPRVAKRTHKKSTKSKIPSALTSDDRSVVDKLNLEGDAWDEDATLKDNFSSLGLMRDVNKGLKEKSRPALPGGVAVRRGASVDEVLAAEAARAQAAADAEDGSDESDEAAAPIEVDSEFLTAAGLGKASRPKPLTERQIRILEGLMDAHGMDVDAMVLDTKRNAMQHSAGALRNMLKSYAYYQGKTAAGFRAPIKKLIGRF